MAENPREPEFLNLPDGYLPFWIRESGGDWWNFDNSSNFWCCDSNGINMQMWFYYDMYYILWMLFYFEFYGDCPNEGSLPFYFMSDDYYTGDECGGSDDIKLSSNPTDDGTGFSMIQGSYVSNMKLILEADQTNYGPDIVLQSYSGLWFYIDETHGNEKISFFETGIMHEAFLQFDVSGPTVGVFDSTIGVNSTPTTAHDSNIYLKPSTHGYVKFGKYTPVQSVITISGYLEMVDEDGKVLKLAVIDYNNEQQEQYQNM